MLALLNPLQNPVQAAGRRSLALRLLEEEPSPAQQVPLLLSLARGSAASHAQQGGGAADDPASGGGSGSNNNEDALARALRKAVESGDPDLVHLVLFAAYKSLQLPEFWRLVCSRPLARRLFVKYARLKVRWLSIWGLLSCNDSIAPRTISMQVCLCPWHFDIALFSALRRSQSCLRHCM
jgi:Vps16, C-terminal region